MSWLEFGSFKVRGRGPCDLTQHIITQVECTVTSSYSTQNVLDISQRRSSETAWLVQITTMCHVVSEISTHLVLNLEVKRSGCNWMVILTRKWLDANISSRAIKYVAFPGFHCHHLFSCWRFIRFPKFIKTGILETVIAAFEFPRQRKWPLCECRLRAGLFRCPHTYGHIVCVQQTLWLVASVFLNAK